jgi:hypothetical protein
MCMLDSLRLHIPILQLLGMAEEWELLIIILILQHTEVRVEEQLILGL